MNALIQSMSTKDARTENGMVTNSSSGNYNLDLFFRGGAMRKADEKEILRLFANAMDEDAYTATRILFWIRDVRGGAGERRFFKTILKGLAIHYPKLIIDNIDLIPEFGRWDEVLDIFAMDDISDELREVTLSAIKNALQSGDQLCAKWMPRKGATAVKLRNALGWSPKRYRKTLVSLTNVVETKMCSNRWDGIEYSKVPSVAMSRYRRAFTNHDATRFAKFSEKVIAGEAKINTGAVYPYDVIKTVFNGYDVTAAEQKNVIAQWMNLPNYMEKSDSIRMLPVCDVSGSMSTIVSGQTSAMLVCIALGMYIAERNEGPFKDYFMTFSQSPDLVKLSGNVVQRVRQLKTSEWGFNTNLSAVFNRLLSSAVRDRVPASDMPTHILIFSDMEFDQAVEVNDTAIENINRQYRDSGYELPNIIFWNIASRHSNIPVKMGARGTALVSGFSPQIVTSLLKGSLDPIQVMMDTIDTDRYNKVRV